MAFLVKCRITEAVIADKPEKYPAPAMQDSDAGMDF
jgi:hypothetical protein